MRTFKITGIGTYYPENIVESSDLEAKYGLPIGWSKRYSGVKSRHHVTTETNAFLGARALEKALAKANMEVKEIDLLISASATYDYPLPNQSSLIKYELSGSENTDFACVDMDATCLSFVAAMDYASRFLDGKTYRNIAIVSSEIASNGLNPKNWETLTLFGDGAAAMILSYDETTENGAIHFDMKTYAEGAFNTIIRGGGNALFFKDNPYSPELHSFKMEGKKLLRMAKQKIPVFMDDFFKDLDFSIEDIDFIIPHQASKMGVWMFEKLYNFSKGQVLRNLESKGNCIAASIPTVLIENIENGTIQKGNTVLLCGTAAGFSIGGILIIV
ncbi:MAG: 3-oxoacyl-[acyl-carrier-protein] synthase III C-terminal domain-containing protein [Saprospiraceae bacterium]